MKSRDTARSAMLWAMLALCVGNLGAVMFVRVAIASGKSKLATVAKDLASQEPRELKMDGFADEVRLTMEALDRSTHPSMAVAIGQVLLIIALLGRDGKFKS